MNRLGVASRSVEQQIHDCVPQIHCWNALRPSSCIKRYIFSSSVLLWDTVVCFLQAHEIGTNLCDPNIHRTPPDVDFESARFLAESASLKNPSPQSNA